LKRPKPTPQPCWNPEQLSTILEATSDSPYHVLFCILAWTGMRISEAKFLTWEDVDLDNRVVRIREKVISRTPPEVWKPKDKDQRVIPLGAPVIAVLGSIPRRGRWVFNAPRTSRHPNSDRQIDDRRVLAHLKRALKALGLPGHTHTFRHSMISRALVSGTPEAVVREWAGHVDSEILRLYTHVADKESKAHMDKLFDGDADRKGGENGGSAENLGQDKES
jgi:integrase